MKLQMLWKQRPFISPDLSHLGQGLEYGIQSPDKCITEASRCYCKNSFHLICAQTIRPLLLARLDSEETAVCHYSVFPNRILCKKKKKKKPKGQETWKHEASNAFVIGHPSGIRCLDLGPQSSAYLHSWGKVEPLARFGLWLSFLSYDRMWLRGKSPESESWLYLLSSLCDVRGNDLTFVCGPPITNGL